MPIKEILRAVVFVHRVADDKDFTQTVNVIPETRMKVLEDGLKQRQSDGELDLVQIGRYRAQQPPFTDCVDEIDNFLEKIDAVRLHSSMDRATPSEGEDSGSIPDGATNFTGFDDVPEDIPERESQASKHADAGYMNDVRFGTD